MGLTRIATPSTRMDATNAIVIQTDKVTIAIRRTSAEGLNATQIEDAIHTAAGAHRLPPIFVHVNRDGTIALAAFQQPKVWPEDVPESK